MLFQLLDAALDLLAASKLLRLMSSLQVQREIMLRADHFKSGHIFFHAGDAPTGIFIIKSGIVKLKQPLRQEEPMPCEWSDPEEL